VIIFVSTHERIVAALKEAHAQNVAGYKEAHAQNVAFLEAQIAELRSDRDYYREQTLKDAGRPSPQSSTALPADLPVTATPTDKTHNDLLDSWEVDDLELFHNWAAERVAELGQAIDPKKLWREKYGTSLPIVALSE